MASLTVRVRRTIAPPTLQILSLLLLLAVLGATTTHAQNNIPPVVSDVDGCSQYYVCNGADVFQLSADNPTFACVCIDGVTGDTYNPAYRCGEGTTAACAKCDADGACLECLFGNQFYNGVCVPCVVENCAACYPGDGNQCQVCTAANWTGESACDFLNPAPVGTCGVAHCDVCVENVITQCAQCSEYFSLDAAGVGLCESECAVPGCQICQPSKQGACAVCQFGFFPNGTVCDGVDTNSTGCRVNHCATCELDGATCQQCEEPYIRTSQGYCSLCADPYCAVCDDNDACTTCLPGYAFNNTSQACELIPCNVPECLYCVVNDSNTCDRCATGNGTPLLGGLCVDNTTTSSPSPSTSTPSPQTCNVYNCEQCRTGNPNRCDTCSPGYTLNSLGGCGRTGACNVYNCLQCQEGLPNRCNTCRNGYGVTTAYTCVKLRSSGTTVIINGAAGSAGTLMAAVLLTLGAMVTALV